MSRELAAARPRVRRASSTRSLRLLLFVMLPLAGADDRAAGRIVDAAVRLRPVRRAGVDLTADTLLFFLSASRRIRSSPCSRGPSTRPGHPDAGRGRDPRRRHQRDAWRSCSSVRSGWPGLGAGDRGRGVGRGARPARGPAPAHTPGSTSRQLVRVLVAAPAAAIVAAACRRPRRRCCPDRRRRDAWQARLLVRARRWRPAWRASSTLGLAVALRIPELPTIVAVVSDLLRRPAR